MRPVQQVSREILTALDRIRPLLDHAPGRAGHPADLTALGEAFGAAGPAAWPFPAEPAVHRRQATGGNRSGIRARGTAAIPGVRADSTLANCNGNHHTGLPSRTPT